MKKFSPILLISLLCPAIAFALSGNSATISMTQGGLLTKDEMLRPDLQFNGVNHYRHLGGTSFRLALTHFFDSRRLRLKRNLKVGIEGGYAEFVKNRYGYVNKDRLVYSGRAISMLGVAKYTTEQRMVILGKLGIARVVQSMDGDVRAKSKTAFNPEFEAGAGYAFTPHFNTTLSYTYIMGKTPELQKNDTVAPVSTINVNLSFSF